MFSRFFLLALALVGASAFARPSFAKEGKDSGEDVTLEEEKEGGGESGEGNDGEGDDGKAGEEDEQKGSKAAAEEAASEKREKSVAEAKGETYRFIGARYRLILVPKFIIGLFADGGKTVAVHSFGPEFVIRKDNFEYQFALSYAPYSMEPTLFKSKTDGEEAWEFAESRLKILYLTADFLWSSELSPELALNYGGGAGIGFVFGSLLRNQAYKNQAGTYQNCIAPGNPPTLASTGIPYCANDNDHYGNYSEPSWTSGGSKPILFPWLAVQTGLRYKPDPKFVARLDVGFGLSGFFFGLGADYGL